MKKNVGTADRMIRIIIAIVIGVLYYNESISGATAIVLLTLAIILVVTSFACICPIYLPFGWSTREKVEA